MLVPLNKIKLVLGFSSKRKSRNREKKSVHHSQSDSGGRQSHHSTLSQIDPRGLPKVSSNGLWVDAPGVYTPAPAGGYYYGRPGQGYRVEQLGMQRPISDRGIPGRSHELHCLIYIVTFK